MRGTIVTPLILIAGGAALLVHNLFPEISFFSLVVQNWPYLLIAWGALRAAEILLRFNQGKPLPARGISGGEWGLIVFLTLSGSAFTFGSNMKNRLWSGEFGNRGILIFSESYEFPINAEMACPAKARVVVDNRRGNVRLVGSDTDKIRVNGVYKIRALDRTAAEQIYRKLKLDLTTQGEQVVVRTNQERAELESSVEANFEVQMPKGVSVDCQGTYGDFDVNQITGDLEVRSANAGVRAQDIGGKVRVDLNRSDIVRLQRVKGTVDIKGARAGDVELDSIEGTVTVDGAFDSLDFRNITALLRFTSRTTDLQVEKILGRVRLSGGELEADKLSGPVRLRSKSKDVRISGFDGPIDIDLDRGDIELAPDTAKLAQIQAKTSGGEVTLFLPNDAKFDLTARTEKGEVQNDFGSPLRTEDFERGGMIAGSTGGAKVVLETRRGTLRVSRGGAWAGRDSAPPLPPLAPKAPAPPTAVER
ncbi:MAG: hypothetical protein OHK0021_09750 [Bryobacter sp.]